MHSMNAPTPRHLTVRNVPASVARALEAERRRIGRSLNQTVIDLLARALGISGAHAPATNGLEKLAGGWSASDLERFEGAIAAFERIDQEAWR